MDLPVWDVPSIRILPKGGIRSAWKYKWDVNHASMVVAEVGFGRIISEGINDAGLNAHLLFLEAADNYTNFGHVPDLDVGLWVQVVLDTCTTVKDVVQLHSTPKFNLRRSKRWWMNWPPMRWLLRPLMTFHLAVQDKSGHCAVIEIYDGYVHIKEGKDAEAMTNDPVLDKHLHIVKEFYPVKENGHFVPGEDDAINRFIRASAMKELLNKAGETEKLQIAHLGGASVATGGKTILPALVSNMMFDVWPTTWRVVNDLNKNVMYFSVDGDFKDVKTNVFDLEEHKNTEVRLICKEPHKNNNFEEQ